MASSAPRRVALVARGRGVGGGEVSLLTLAQALPRGFEPIVWVTEEGELAERAAAAGLPVEHGRWELPDRRRPWRFFSLVRQLRSRIAQLGVSVVHVNSPVEAPAFISAARLAGVPCVVHIRIAYPVDFLQRQGLGLADAVVFNSHALRREVGWPGHADVIHNGVRVKPAEGARERWRREWNAAEDEFVLGQVGQVIPIKGVDLSLRAVASLQKRGLTARLVVVGDDHQRDGEHRREMEELARSLSIESQVHFAGYRRDAAECMAGLDLLLCPSRAEPFGRVLIEAMANGVPAVAARVGGIPEVVRDGIEGRLVPPDRAAELGDAIHELWKHPHRRAAMADAGRQRALDVFSDVAHAQMVAGLYERIAACAQMSPQGAA